MKHNRAFFRFSLARRRRLRRDARTSIIAGDDADRRYESLETPPVVGDYVALDERVRRVVAIRPRSSWIARTRAKGDPQFIAANVTTAFVVTSPESRELSPRRITRYFIALRSGHVEPVVLLNKCETDAVLAEHLNALRAIAEAAPVLPISARDGAGCEALSPYLTDQATVVLCGSSGVGKSTLLNRLCGTPVMPTADMREDGRGRHTTTVRRLITLPGGATRNRHARNARVYTVGPVRRRRRSVRGYYRGSGAVPFCRLPARIGAGVRAA